MTEPPAQPGPDADPSSLTYEQAIEMVEAIADQIESGEIGLEASIAAYERGMKLIRRCREVLESAEQRISELTDAPPERDETR